MITDVNNHLTANIRINIIIMLNYWGGVARLSREELLSHLFNK